MTTLRLITGRHVLIGFLGFFGLIFAVNGALVYFAIDSWPGLDVEGAYERGLNYNDTLDAAERQAKLNWNSRVAIIGRTGEPQTVRVDIADRDGRPVTGLTVAADIRRTTHQGADQRVSLKERGPGIYSATVNLSLAGIWRIAIEAQSKTGAPYLMAHQIMVAE